MDIGDLTGQVSIQDQVSDKLHEIAERAVKFAEELEGSFGVAAMAGLGLGAALAGVGVTVVEIGEKIADLAMEGDKIAGVENAFNRLAESVGTTGDAILGGLLEGTKNTIDDFDLMLTTTKLLGSGMKVTEDQARLLGAAGRELGKSMGKDALAGVEMLSSALATGRAKGLAMQGVVVDLKKAQTDYADSIGRSADALTKNQKLEASRAAILKSTQEWLDRVGVSNVTFTERVQQGAQVIDNWKDALVKAVSESQPVRQALETIAAGLDAVFSDNSQDMIDMVVTGINYFAKGVATAAVATVEAGRLIIDIVRGMGTAWFAFAELVDRSLKGMFEGIADLAEKTELTANVLKNLPGAAGDVWAVVEGGMKKVASTSEKAASGIQKNINKNTEATIEFNKSLDKAAGFLNTIEIKMLKAANAQYKLGETKGTGGKGGGGGDDDVTEQMKAAAEASNAAILQLQAEYYQNLARLENDSIKQKLIADQAWYDSEMQKLEKTKNLTQAQMNEQAAWIKDVYDTKVALDQKEFADKQLNEFKKFEKLKQDLNQQSIDAQRAEMDKRGQIMVQGYLTLVKANDDYVDQINRSTMSSTDYQITQIEKWAQDQKDAFKGTEAQAKEYYALIDKMETEKIRTTTFGGQKTQAELNRAVNDAIKAYQAVARESGNTSQAAKDAWKRVEEAEDAATGGVFRFRDALKEVVDRVPQTLADAFTGGGDWLGAIKSITSQFGKVFGQGITAALGFTGPLGQAIGSAIGSLAGGVVDLFKKIFSTAGRDSVKAFADKFGGFEPLHQKLLDELGKVGEDFWIQLTQRVKRGDAAGAKAVEDAIEAAFANSPSAKAANAGYKTIAQLKEIATEAEKLYEYMRDSGEYSAQAVADAYQKAKDAAVAAMDSAATAAMDSAIKARDAAQKTLDELDSQIKNLQQAVDAEAPEEVMGSIEAMQRKQLEGLEKQRAEAQAKVDDLNKQIEDAVSSAVEAAKSGAATAGKFTVDAIQDALDAANFRVKVYVQTEGGSSGTTPSNYASGGIVQPRYYGTGGVVWQPRGSDTVPAMLTPGERVQSVSEVREQERGNKRPLQTTLTVNVGNSTFLKILANSMVTEGV